MNKPLCSIVILSYNKLEYTKQCLESIRKYTTDIDYDIIIVDNNSDKEVIDYLEKIDDIKLILNEKNLGFAGGCNQGIEASSAKYIMLLNNDTVVTRKWLYNMVQYLEEHIDVSMVGPLTNATVGKQMITVPYGQDLENMQKFAAKIADNAIPAWRTLRLVAFCLLIRRDLIEEIGLLDTHFEIGNYEDDDYNIRALCKKKKSYICRNSFVHHFMNISFGQKEIQREQIMHRNKILLEEKWNNMNWNHNAAYSQFILEKILKQRGKNILHIGCGLGALAIELKDNEREYYVAGVEEHPIRRKIASQFVDAIYSFDKEMQFMKEIEYKFDVIVIESILEKTGIILLENIKKFMNQDSIILLRVFNVQHITSLERLVTGKIQGKLLCAMSDEFSFHYDNTLIKEIEKMNYYIMDKKDIIKSFSCLQSELYHILQEYMQDKENTKIYNRIYELKLKEMDEICND